MSDGNDTRQRWLFLAVAFLAFGAAMFVAGRATAPDAATDVIESTASSGSAGDRSDAAANDSTGAASDGSGEEPGGEGIDGAAQEDLDTSDGAVTDDVAAADDSDRLPPGCDRVDYDTIPLSELPPEAYDTLTLIDEGPPFPYDQDGGVFQNREGYLPDRDRGYYHEYTVETPGSDDRGARRIVTGECGELYYTSDHYDSFDLIDIER